MAYEVGGRADKYGNRYEYNWTLFKLLDVIDEKIESVKIEGLGKEEVGTDIWITYKDGKCEAQQCKGRNGSQETWDFSSINSSGILSKWKYQLERSDQIEVALVSPLSFTVFEDIVSRARTNGFNAKVFYETQIMCSGQATISLFNKTCEVLGVNPSEEIGMIKALNFFSRMHYIQFPDGVLREIVLEKIIRIFNGNPEYVYGVLLNYIINKENYGSDINLIMITTYLQNNDISFRDLSHDERVLPTIVRLNEDYEQLFNPFSCGLIQREETKECLSLIKQGKSVVLHGDAGVGKSGCIENLIRELKQEGIAYISIRLDRSIPSGSTEKWAEQIGLPASITYCMDAITKDKAVVILDQLDTLRWTQAHSVDALTICFRLIKEIECINQERDIPISLVFVCRSYDLNNDKAINRLFREEKWVKVAVGQLKDHEIKMVLGDRYDEIPLKTKDLLRIPSNLYIWERIDKEKIHDNIGATYQLIRVWWDQISCAGHSKNLNTNNLECVKKQIVDFCYREEKTNVPRVLLDMPAEYEEFLVSSGIILVNQSVVSFVHQSVLDCFFAEEMLRRFYSKDDILEIIGGKEDQTPVRRYLTQIFLQQLSEVSVSDFLRVGHTLLYASCIRYSFKFIFIEMLSQFNPVDKIIVSCVLELLNDPNWEDSIVSAVIHGSVYYVHLLRDKGILDKWMDGTNKDRAMELVYSIKERYDDKDVMFIKKYILDGSDIHIWIPCFRGDITQDTDSFFEFRLELYSKYPKLFNQCISFNIMMSNFGIRIIRLLAIALKNLAFIDEDLLRGFSKKTSFDDKSVFDSYYKEILDYFINLFPELEDNTIFSKYSGSFAYKDGLERTCVTVVKRATELFAEKEPEKFLEYYSFAFDKGNSLYNEIILDGMYYLNASYADYVIEYLTRKSFVNAIEDTSGSGNKLFLAKKLIRKFTPSCMENTLTNFERILLSYIEPDAKGELESRIMENHDRRIKKENLLYSSFWGDIQLELIPEIDANRRSSILNELLLVLQRRNNGFRSKYDYEYYFSMCSVVSPVSGKHLSVADWVSIICRVGSMSSNKTKWDHKNRVCIESSLEMFATDFRKFVSDNPMGISKYMCDVRTIKPHDRFIDELFVGLSDSSKTELISENTLVELIKIYGYDYESNRAAYISELIGKISIVDQKDYLSGVLWDIIENHNDSNLVNIGEGIDKNKNDFNVETLEISVRNCACGRALHAFSNLLWGDTRIYEKYKSKIKRLITKSGLVVRYALLEVLFSIYSFDRTWSLRNIFILYHSDIRLVGFLESRRLFCFCYNEYADEIKELMISAYNTDDIRLNYMAGYSIVELYMINDMFDDVYELYVGANKTTRKSMLEMIIVYFGISDYRNKAKCLLEKLIILDDDKDNCILWSELFREKTIKLDEDKTLIMAILESKKHEHVLLDFTDYILEERKTLEYADVILEFSQNVIESSENLTDKWKMEWQLTNLIFCLYDESSNSFSEDGSIISSRCLDLWDKMYEKNIGMARELTEQMLKV